MTRTRTRRRTPEPLHVQIDRQRAVYLGLLAAWTDATHRQLYRDARALYAYHVPSTATAYGQLLTVAEGEAPPAGAALMDPERISGFITRDQLYAWIKRRADVLPMYPHLDEGTR